VPRGCAARRFIIFLRIAARMVRAVLFLGQETAVRGKEQ
jgi:hypothetical protein